MASNNEESYESGDYTRFGIPDAPPTTVTTPFGKTKTCAGLSLKERSFLGFSIINVLAALALTIYSLAKADPHSVDFTLCIIILINAAFILFYILHGVFRERKYELYVQICAILVILVYCIGEYIINKEHRSDVKLVRLIIACVLAPPNIILSFLVARDFGELEFRIAGASGSLQHIYNQAAIFSCWLKFDLQVTITLVVLVLKEDASFLDTLEIVTLSVGIPYTIFWVILGWFSLRLELRIGAWLFAGFGLVKPAYYLFKISKLYRDIDIKDVDPAHAILYSSLFCLALAITSWAVLMFELVQVYQNFDKGLKERGKITFGAFLIEPGAATQTRPT